MILGAEVVAFVWFILFVAMWLTHQYEKPGPDLRNWTAVATRYGLQRHSLTRMSGRVGALDVDIAFENGAVVFRITGLRHGIVLAKEATGLSRLFTGADVVTGDRAFDERVLVQTTRAEAMAYLDVNARRLTSAGLASFGFELANGVLGSSCSGPEPLPVEERLEKLLELAACFQTEDAALIPVRLVRNATTDPNADVRLRCLTLLLAEFPGEAPESACRVLLKDPDATVRLLAARSIGAEGFPTLEAIAGAREIDSAIRLDALDSLLRRAPSGEVLRLVTLFLHDPEVTLLVRAVDEAGNILHRPSVPTLLKIATEREYPARAAAATSLHKIRDPVAEHALIELLALDDAPTLRAAISALADLGTADSVEPLTRLVNSGFRGDPEMKLRAGSAIERIQDRLKGADPGQLSLVEPRTSEEGQLSIAGQAGALSTVKKITT